MPPECGRRWRMLRWVIWSWLVLGAGSGRSDRALATPCKLFYPSEYAVESITARGPGRDWTAQEIREINRIGNTYGCHTCNAKQSGYNSGTWVKDHLPVSTFNNGGPWILPPHLHEMRR